MWFAVGVPVIVDAEFQTVQFGTNEKNKENLMKKLTLSFWLALAAAGIFALQAAAPRSSNVQTDLPLPTCPPDC